MDSAVFKVSGISKKFKEDFWKKDFFALKDVSFELKRGELVGFLGANGAGKTTLIKILLEFINKTSGEISFHSEMGKDREIFKNIGYMPERPYYYPHLTGIEFLTFCGELQGMSQSEIIEKSNYWAKELNIEHALNRVTKSYSKGMLQRLGFVSTLIHDPKLIILDEPLAGLDPIGRKEFKDILRSLNRMGKTIFFSSHIVSDVEEICQRVVVLESGKILYSGDIDQLIEKNLSGDIFVTIDSNKDIDEVYNQFIINKKGTRSILVLNKKNKDMTIKNLIKQGVSIYSIENDKTSLEEIVYKIRKTS